MFGSLQSKPPRPKSELSRELLPWPNASARPFRCRSRRVSLKRTSTRHLRNEFRCSSPVMFSVRLRHWQIRVPALIVLTVALLWSASEPVACKEAQCEQLLYPEPCWSESKRFRLPCERRSVILLPGTGLELSNLGLGDLTLRP